MKQSTLYWILGGIAVAAGGVAAYTYYQKRQQEIAPGPAPVPLPAGGNVGPTAAGGGGNTGMFPTPPKPGQVDAQVALQTIRAAQLPPVLATGAKFTRLR